MAIYRPQRRRWTMAAVVGLTGLLVGLLAGYLLRSGPDPVEAIEETRTELLGAAATLEIVRVEFAEAVEDGEIVARPEYEGALDALASSRERYVGVAGVVAVLSPETDDAVREAYEGLESMLRDLAGEEDVAAATENLARMLTGALRA